MFIEPSDYQFLESQDETDIKLTQNRRVLAEIVSFFVLIFRIQIPPQISGLIITTRSIGGPLQLLQSHCFMCVCLFSLWKTQKILFFMPSSSLTTQSDFILYLNVQMLENGLISIIVT
jgi:hypothetical protein